MQMKIHQLLSITLRHHKPGEVSDESYASYFKKIVDIFWDIFRAFLW